MRLQASPHGLLGLFQLKQEGRNPSQFGEQVLPVVDVLEQYALAYLDVTRANKITGAAATTDTQTITVPQGKVWKLRAIGQAVNLNAADLGKSVNFATYIDSPAGVGTPIFMGSGGGLATVADRVAPLTLGSDLWLPSGWKIRSVMTISAALAANASYDLWVLRTEIDG